MQSGPWIPLIFFVINKFVQRANEEHRQTLYDPCVGLCASYRRAFAEARGKLCQPIWCVHHFSFSVLFCVCGFWFWFFVLVWFFVFWYFFKKISFFYVPNFLYSFCNIRWTFFQYTVNIYFKYGEHFSNIQWTFFVLYMTIF